MDINVGNDCHKYNANDGYLGGDRNQNCGNACHVTDGSGSRTSEEVSLSFQTSAVGTCIGGARTEPRQDYHSTLLIERGHCGVNSYEIGETSRGTGVPDPSYGSRPICKYYVQGRCQNAQKCRFPHYIAHQRQMGQIQGAMHPIHGASNSGDDYRNIQLKYPEISQYEISQYKGSPLVDFDSQVQHKHEACSQWPPFLSSIRTNTNNINSEQFQSTHARNGNLSRKTGLHTATLTAPWIVGQVTESQETICGIREAPTVQFTTDLPAATTPWPSNDQLHKNEFSVHQKTQGDFVVPQPHVNSPVSLQGQPVLLRAHVLPDFSAHNGQRFDFDGQILKNLVASTQSKEISKQVQGTGVQSMQMQSTWNSQPVVVNVQGQHQTSQKFSVLPNKRSADMVGAQIHHNTASSEGACIIPNLSPYNSKTPLTAGPVRKQLSKRNQDPRLATRLSAAPSSVHVPPNQQGVMVQPETSVLSGRKVHMFEIPIDSNGNPEILSHSVTLSAGNTIVNPSEGNKGESKCTVQVKENDNKQTNEHKMFKNALINFAKEGLKEAWHRGRLTKELYKVIVRKVVEKIISSEKNIPKTKQRIGSYMKFHKRKMDRLVQEYLGKYTNGKLCR